MTGTLCFDQSHTHAHGARRRNRIMSGRVAGDVAEVANVSASQWDVSCTRIVTRVETIRIPRVDGCKPLNAANVCKKVAHTRLTSVWFRT